MSDESYYTILGISETATQDEIDRAYRNFIEAYHVLSDSIQRLRYDQQLAQYRQKDAFYLLPTEPPKAAATPPLLSHASLADYPVTYVTSPSAGPEPQAGEADSDWWDLAPLAIVLLLLAFPLCVMFAFNSHLGRSVVLVLTVPVLAVLARWSLVCLGKRALQVEQARLPYHHHPQ